MVVPRLWHRIPQSIAVRHFGINTKSTEIRSLIVPESGISHPWISSQTPPILYTSIFRPGFIIHRSLPPSLHIYQLAFFTPGNFPAKAFTRKLYCKRSSATITSTATLLFAVRSHRPRRIILPAMGSTYPRHLEISQHTTSLSSLYTPVSDLCWACVAVHLC